MGSEGTVSKTLCLGACVRVCIAGRQVGHGQGGRQSHVCTHTHPSFWDNQAAGLLLSTQAPVLGTTEACKENGHPGPPKSESVYTPLLAVSPPPPSTSDAEGLGRTWSSRPDRLLSWQADCLLNSAPHSGLSGEGGEQLHSSTAMAIHSVRGKSRKKESKKKKKRMMVQLKGRVAYIKVRIQSAAFGSKTVVPTNIPRI